MLNPDPRRLEIIVEACFANVVSVPTQVAIVRVLGSSIASFNSGRLFMRNCIGILLY